MPSDDSVIQDLLHEIRSGLITPERYSRLSWRGRNDRLVTVTVLATIAVVSGMLLGRMKPADR